MNDETMLLSRISGTVTALVWLPCGRTLPLVALRRVEHWLTAYGSAGLSFGRSKVEADTLRKLTADGLVESNAGRTKNSLHRLTWRGMLATLPPDGDVDGAALIAFLRMIADMQSKSTITLPGSGTPILLGCHLLKSAGAWFCKANSARYAEDLTELENHLLPAMILGWITRYTDRTGALWALGITDSGRQAILNLPDLDVQIGDMYDGDAWLVGCGDGLRIFPQTNAPTWTRSTLTRRIPSSAWC